MGAWRGEVSQRRCAVRAMTEVARLLPRRPACCEIGVLFMPPESRPTSAVRIRRRGQRAALLFFAMAALLFGVGAWLLADSQSRDRQQLRDRYSNGAIVATALIDALFKSASNSQAQQLAQQFGGKVS